MVTRGQRKSSRALGAFDESVFVNVPFDTRYQKLFRALVFAVHDCGFVCRCALESDDGSDIRFEKLVRIIRECRYGIHDISRTTLDRGTQLPRFNMPLELGLFLGAKRFGAAEQARKTCLILERDRYRYQQFCSDLAGQDIRAHHNRVDDGITAVRNWLQATRPKVRIPSSARIAARYVQFRTDLPKMCTHEDLHSATLTFLDYRTLVTGWLEANGDF
ncbi:MAG: hypothetical protein SFV15_21050 [Polyangiaceae bacterium]|nr:hypothetical protein [Polyangiaceae bacterium]